MAVKFVMYQDKAKKCRFRLVAANGEIIAASEAYESKAACVKGIESVKKNAPVAIIVDEIEKAPAAKKPAAKKPAAKKPAVKKAPAKKPAAKKPATKKPVAKKPAPPKVTP